MCVLKNLSNNSVLGVKSAEMLLVLKEAPETSFLDVLVAHFEQNLQGVDISTDPESAEIIGNFFFKKLKFKNFPSQKERRQNALLCYVQWAKDSRRWRGSLSEKGPLQKF